MGELDRLGWVDGISFLSYGLRIGIRVNAPDAVAQIRQSIPRSALVEPMAVVDHLYSLYVGAPPRGGRRHFHQLYFESERIARTASLENVVGVLEFHLDSLIARTAPRDIFVHAGVVGWNGQAIVMPGRSMSGKTTLVAALLAAGATYYSDEYAVLGESGAVQPFPRPLSVRQADGLRRKIEPVGFGSPVGEQPLPVGLVVFTDYQPGASWRPRLLTPGQALLALLRNTLPARTRTHAALPVLRDVVMRSPALKGRRGPAEAAARHVLEYLGTMSELSSIEEER